MVICGSLSRRFDIVNSQGFARSARGSVECPWEDKPSAGGRAASCQRSGGDHSEPRQVRSSRNVSHRQLHLTPHRAILNVCMPYTARDEITRAVQRTIEKFEEDDELAVEWVMPCCSIGVPAPHIGNVIPRSVTVRLRGKISPLTWTRASVIVRLSIC